ncbi:MAG: hypothetical protein HQL06_09445 [Nitrospirae bacterium]|nr:hypothetical protein [Nitrospirota bacterium]
MNVNRVYFICSINGLKYSKFISAVSLLDAGHNIGNSVSARKAFPLLHTSNAAITTPSLLEAGLADV